MLKKSRHILLSSIYENPIPALQKFGKGLQVAQIRFTSERP